MGEGNGLFKMILLYVLLGALAGLAVFVWFLTLWGARNMLLAGGFRRPLTVRPEDFALPYEKVSFQNADGLTLRGWFIPSKTPTDRALILCHGWGTNKGEILPATHFLAERFNLLYFDFRFCGESDGSLSSLGYLESRDFDAALDFLKSRKAAQAATIGVYGLSLGAATGFMAAARHPELKAAVLENPFPSYVRVCRTYAWHKWRIPYYPLVAMVVWHATRILGVDPEAWSTRYFADKIEKPAVFLIHAENDPLAPPEESRALYALVKGDKELWIVGNAGHEDIHEIAKGEYQRRIGAFYERYL